MSSNGKFTLSGDPNSKKQRGVGADSFPGTNRSIGKHGGSSGLSIGDPHSKKSKGDVSVSSPGLNKPISTTGDSPGVPTGVSNSKKPNDNEYDHIYSAGPIVERTKTGVSSGVRGKAAGQLLEGRLIGNIQPNDPKNLTEGDIYEFSGFSVIHNSRHRKLTQLPYYIQIDQKTITSKVTDIGPIFPVHNFSPQNYKNLLCLATTHTYLSDVVGQILIIQKRNLYHPKINIDATIGLRLNRSTMVKLILCDKQAANFSILQSKKNRKFKVVIITSIIPKLFQGQYQEAIVDDVSPSTVYGAEHLLRLFVKLPDLFSYVNMEEETWSRMQQTLLRLHQVSNLISSPFSYHFGRTVKFTITLKPFTGSFRRILEFRNFLMNS
ncbi:hypothetical protein HID58_056446 [Brassica napus]|uniref:MRG domain-containing protein n=2 Tax=Brassica TaxID=3705 RepID=A0ABQ8ANA3_BRANA|nr:hypothetical protein HID58_056446 [Brassica napus]